MNLGEYRRTVHRRSGVDYEAAALTEVVNEALQAVAAAGDWPWLERFSSLVLTPGTGSYAMPSDWQRTRSLTIDGDEVPFVSVRDLDAEPTHFGYSTSGDSLTISPTPSTAQTVRMRYLASESVLSSDGDTPKLPPQYDGAVIAYAVAEVHRRRGNLKAAAIYDESFEAWLDRVRKGIVRATGPRRIRVRPGSVF